MKGVGIFVGLAGVVVAIGALFYPTAVDVTTLSPSIDTLGGLSSYPSQVPGAIYNLGRLQEQMMLYVLGVSLSVAGVVLFAAGTLLDRWTEFRVRTLADVPFVESAVPHAVAHSAAREMSAEEAAEIDRAGNIVVVVIACVVGVMFLAALVAIAMTR